MRKVQNLIHLRAKLFALICVLTLSVGNVNAEYWQLRVKAILPDGSPANSLVSAYGYDQSAVTPTLSDYTMPAPDNSWYSNGPDAYLKSLEAEGEYFVGWYSEEACTNLLSSSANVELWGSSYWGTSVATAAAPEDVEITTIYAKFEKRYVPDFIWTPYGEAPVDGGRYYIYNTANYRFLKAPSTSAFEKEDATIFIYSLVSNESGFDYINLAYDDNGETRYVNGGSSSWSSSVYNCELVAKEGDKYCITEDYSSLSYANHLQMNANGTISYPCCGSQGDGIYWVFIPCEECKHTLYYAANAETNKGGSVKVSFENPVPGEATSITQGNVKSFEKSVPVTAYFKAVPEDGYEFVGWKKSPAGDYVSFEETYSETFEVTSTSEASPTTLTMYAYFEKESDDEAQLVSAETGAVTYTGDFVTALSQASNGYTIILLRNVNLGSSAKTISNNITLDFNNRTISGTVSNLFTVNGNVTFSDNSIEAAGGIRVVASEVEEINALTISSSATLNHKGGIISVENTSEDAAAKATGIAVSSGATLNLGGGRVKAEAQQNAYGVKVPNGATANLTTGAINASATDNAYGVLANGITNISWSVVINATTEATNAIGVLVDNASANTSISGGVIAASAGTTNAYGIQVSNSTVAISKNAAVRANAGTTTTAYALKQDGSGVVNVATGRFASNNTQDVIAATTANLKLSGGYYVHSTALATYKASSEVEQSTLKEGTKFYTEGYRYMLSDGENPNYVVASATTADATKYFSSLEDAITYANNNTNTEMTIRLEVTDYTLQAGNYTIPAKATLLIPYKENQEAQSVVERHSGHTNTQAKPHAFSKLTLVSGAHIDVYGVIEAGAVQNNPYKQSDWAIGMPEDACGYIYLQSGSQIVLSNGATLRAWGYVYGDGTIDARRGSMVKEMFQVLDFCGGSIFTASVLDAGGKGHRVFPLSQYFIQNVESKVTYHPGSKLLTSMALYPGSEAIANDIIIIGSYDKLDGSDDDQAMFLMSDADDSEDTWVCKYYDATTDKQVYEINNSALLGSLYISVGSTVMNTFDFDLPLTNNMQIHLLTGEMGITQRTVMLPGSEIIIDKKSTVTVLDDPSIAYDGALFLWDQAQWSEEKYVFNKFYAQKVKYCATLDAQPTVRWSGTSGNSTSSPASAAINVKGTLQIDGAIYTTAGGANIFSDDADAGQVVFTVAAKEDANIYHLPVGGPATSGFFTKHLKNDNPYKTCTSAQLKNASGYTVTKGNATAGDVYGYVNGAWKILVEDENNSCVMIDKTDPEDWKYLAKPRDYVELFSDEEDGTTHLYYSKDKSREFILFGDCQWWEVEDVEENDKLKHCVHPDNRNKFYYWDDSNPDPAYQEWKEKHFTVTWVTKPYEELEENQGRVVYNVDYKTTPKYNGATPSREMTAYYTYDFTGWLPEIVPVTDDAVYVAQFQQNDRKYLITFLDEDGSVLEEALWKMGDVPAPVNEPTPSGKKLVWEPTIQAVSGEATYRATYTDIVLPAYQITFVNWDGTQLQRGNVATGTVPEYTGDTPEKPSLADVAFEFEGWTPDLAPVDGEAIYTAKFREKPATYTITFKRAVGNEGVVIDPAETIQTLELGYGETPVCTSAQLPTKTSTAAEYYTVVWSPLITAVTGNATYTATGFAAHKNTCRLTVSAGANGKVALDGSEEVLSAVYEYGNTATIEATATAEGYSFKRWSDGNTTNPRTVTVNAAISLTAEFALNQYEITWNNEGGTLIEKTVVNYGVVPSHVAPTKATDASNTYSFAGWTPTPVAAITNTTYTATFNATPIEYTIRIVLNNGMNDIVYEGKHYDDPITIGTPVKASKNGVDYTFSHWTNSADENIGTTIPNVTRNEIYYAQYSTHINDLKAGNSEDANAKDLVLTETGMEAQSLIIESVGTVNITGSVTVQNLIVESNGTTSGQLLGSSSDRLTINEHAYFDLTLNAQRRTWYAVAVPWAVDCRTGISIKGGRQLVLGRDFDLVYYQGDVRASQGAGAHCWKYAEDGDGDKIMHPGRLYMMYFGSEIETIRFENNNDTPFDDAVLTVTPYAASETDDANWNGVANPQVYHATLSAGGATYGYYLNNGKVDEYMVGEGEPTYKLVNLASYNAIVGKPLFIQAVNNTSIATTPKIAAAPRRIREIEIEEGVETVYEVTFGAEGSANKDNIFIQTVETKEDGYVLGQDLLKAGMSTKLPQMWINRYDKKLSVNTATPVNGVHEYPLTLNIPLTGDYTIAIESTQGDTEALYLTKNGNVIWNLSNGEYAGSFEKGTETSYGLRTAAKAPQITTGIDEAVVDANGAIQKVIINDQVFIIRGENVYSVDGQLVK